MPKNKHKLEKIIKESPKYIITKSHNLAINKLEKLHSIVITGEAGIGKTFLANQLCLHYINKDYKFYFIENSLDEIEDFYNKDSKQVFYFDDFLGKNFLLALNSHQGFEDKNKRFILTSRSNVLNKGMLVSDLFEFEEPKKSEYELSISSLTDIEKAKILYSHMFFSKLDKDYINEIYKDKRYLKVIKHDNFNPRLISFITNFDYLPSIKADKYWEYIKQNLSNPKDIWRDVFELQIDDISRHIIIAMSLHGQAISEDNLNKLYDKIVSSNLEFKKNKTCDIVLKELTDTLLSRVVNNDNTISYNLVNPSISDFVIRNYLADFNYIDELLSCLKTPESISNLNSLILSKAINREYFYNLLDLQLIKLSEEENCNKIDSYKLRILYYYSYSSLSLDRKMLKYIKRVAVEAVYATLYSNDFDYYYYEFINWTLLLGAFDIKDPAFLEILNKWVLSSHKKVENIISISKIVAFIEESPSTLTSKIKEQYIKYLSNKITADTINDDVLSNIYDYKSLNNTEITDYVRKRFLELAVSFNEDDVKQVSKFCDIDYILQKNVDMKNHEIEVDDYYEDENDNFESNGDIINTLFKRN